MDWNFVVLCLWFLLSGIEYAIILPSINEFLNQVVTDKTNQSFYLGFALSAFSLTGLIFSPIYGRITDKTNSVKLTIVISNLFEIAGNFMYMASNNGMMVVVARLIAGIGSGSGSSIFGAVSKTTSKEERTPKLAQLMSVRQVGLIIGPAFNILLTKLDFYWGTVHVNNLSGAGFFMALIWSVYTIGMMVFYKESSISKGSDEENESLVSENKNDYGSTTQNSCEDNFTETNENVQSWSSIFADLFREEIIVCLAAQFFIMFIQTGFETILTPLTSQYFGWNSQANSLLFLGGGIDVLISFLVMAKLSKFLSDRLMILIGFSVCFILTGFYIPFIYYAQFAPQGTTWVYICFIGLTVFFIFNLPFLFTPHVSLFSKLTNVETQAFNQGVRLSVRGLGQILGPIWASSLTGEKLPIMFGVNMFTNGIVVVMIILSYKKLDVQQNFDTINS